MKYVLIVLLGLGVYAGINVVSAESADKDFAQAIQQIVDRHAGLDGADLAIPAGIRKEAARRGIELAPDAIEMKHSRSSIGGGVDYVIVKATVSYERSVLPFYSRSVKVSRVNQRGG
jgi:hypothetical protein